MSCYQTKPIFQKCSWYLYEMRFLKGLLQSPSCPHTTFSEKSTIRSNPDFSAHLAQEVLRFLPQCASQRFSPLTHPLETEQACTLPQTKMQHAKAVRTYISRPGPHFHQPHSRCPCCQGLVPIRSKASSTNQGNSKRILKDNGTATRRAIP